MSSKFLCIGMKGLLVLIHASFSLSLSFVANKQTRPLHGHEISKEVKYLEEPPKFLKDFTRPMSIPEEGIEAAVRVMRSGRLFRYSATSGETSEVAMAEKEFAELMGFKYAFAVNSCSSAIMLGLMTVGVEAGDKVLTNGFTFTALPSTIMRLGAEPVLVEATPEWTMCLNDLEEKMSDSNAKVLLLSHMRGKVCDMDIVEDLCKKYSVTLVEDCAHGCGVEWRGRQLGYHAKVTAYSTQSDKVINSGEGGFVTTDDDEIAAKVIYLSGCYERRYDKHLVRPASSLCETALSTQPNLSCRMNEVTAAAMRPLIRSLPDRVACYNARYETTVRVLEEYAGDIITIPKQDPRVGTVGDHLNFYLRDVTDEENKIFMDTAKKMGVPVSWFSSPVNARWHVNWRKYGAPHYDLPNTDSLLRHAYDLKMPPYFEDSDFPHFAKCLAYAANVAKGRA